MAGKSNTSWPIGTFGSFAYRSQTMTKCNRAGALADFIYWSQSSSIAINAADRYVIDHTPLKAAAKLFGPLMVREICNQTRLPAADGVDAIGSRLNVYAAQELYLQGQPDERTSCVHR